MGRTLAVAWPLLHQHIRQVNRHPPLAHQHTRQPSSGAQTCYHARRRGRPCRWAPRRRCCHHQRAPALRQPCPAACRPAAAVLLQLRRPAWVEFGRGWASQHLWIVTMANARIPPYCCGSGSHSFGGCCTCPSLTQRPAVPRQQTSRYQMQPYHIQPAGRADRPGSSKRKARAPASAAPAAPAAA